MSPAFRGAIALALLGLAAGSQPSQAQVTQTYSTNIVNPFYTNVASFTTTTSAASPTFNRPALALGTVTPSPTGTSGIGSAVGYAASSFAAASTGAYRITTTINSGYADPVVSPTGTDNFVQALYGSGGFTPTRPLSNIILAYSQPFSGSSYQTSLTGGTNYTLVNAGYYNSTLTGANLSVGSATTSVDVFNSGTQMGIPSADVLGESSTESQTLSLIGGSPILSFNSIVIAGLTDSAAGNLTATLSHNGVSATLFDRPANGDYGNIAAYDASQTYTFADSGANLASTLNSTVLNGTSDPYVVQANTFKSLGALSVFDGAALAGDWTLSLTDTGAGSTGSFLGFYFNTTSATPAAVPESSTWIGMSVGCLLLGFLIRRRAVRAA